MYAWYRLVILYPILFAGGASVNGPGTQVTATKFYETDALFFQLLIRFGEFSDCAGWFVNASFFFNLKIIPFTGIDASN